ncbi:MAG: hypothetical protein OEM22_07120 [Acidimicrobiia bacterium]|nr:hypothetical protein [Acidimicrobiia bacterium]MDH3471090.1 hypothetical protein [Acidimicrobiia bacterium]
MDRADLIFIGLPLAIAGAWALIFRHERRLPWWGVDIMAAAFAVGGGFVIYEARRNDGEGRIDLDSIFDGIFDGWLEASLVAVISGAALVAVVLILQRVIISWQRMAAIAVGAIATTMVVKLFEDGIPTF